MQGYISKSANRPGTAKGAKSSMGASVMGSKMPASKPSNMAALMSPLPGMKGSGGGGPKSSSRGIDWDAIAQKMPTSKNDPV
jgi:hypothetical protein